MDGRYEGGAGECESMLVVWCKRAETMKLAKRVPRHVVGDALGERSEEGIRVYVLMRMSIGQEYNNVHVAIWVASVSAIVEPRKSRWFGNYSRWQCISSFIKPCMRLLLPRPIENWAEGVSRTCCVSEAVKD